MTGRFDVLQYFIDNKLKLLIENINDFLKTYIWRNKMVERNLILYKSRG